MGSGQTWQGGRIERLGLLITLLLAMLLAVLLAMAIQATPVLSGDARIHLDVHADPSDPEIELLLQQAGFEIELSVPELGRWQGWLPSHLLDELRSLDGVISAESPHYGRFASGSALTEGDEALHAASARTRFDVDGSGIRVAVISDGIVGLPQAQDAGEAPKLVDAQAFGAGSLSRGQEGTVMIEIVHDLAPGAEISFAAVTTDLDHIAAVNYYAQRVDIIVDDVSYAFPADQRSDVSVNTTRALRHPNWPIRLYVTAAGNWAESHWAGEWRPGTDGLTIGLANPGATHRFSSATGSGMLYGAGNALTVEPDSQIRLALFWDDEWGRSTNDYNLFLMSGDGKILASSETTQGIGANSHMPREHLEYVHEGEAMEMYVVIQNHNDDAEPVSFDLFAFHAAGVQLRLHHSTPTGSILAQADAQDALTVGAINVGRDTVARYSSRGPTVNGAPKPDLIAVDRVTVSNTTHFAPRFSGSSAAAPHVAGVAALLLEAQPALLAKDGGTARLERRLIRDLLIDTAQDLPPEGHDSASGAGLINADAAIEAATSRIAVITSIADRGPGTLREALDGDATILLFQSNGRNRTVRLESPLPLLQGGLTVDGRAWTLNASAVDVGIRLGDETEIWGLTVRGANDVGISVEGDACQLNQVTVDANEVGIRIAGEQATIDGSMVLKGRTHGIEIIDGASASISASMIESNRGAGIRIFPNAGDVNIGPQGEPPAPTLASNLQIPVGQLDSTFPMPRSGLSHSLNGTVSIDGLPAPAHTTVNLYLDRRLAASVAVDESARFVATATGPGTELRFAVNGVPVEHRVDFQAGAETSINLRAVSRDTLQAADRSGDHQTGANLFRNNLAGVRIMPSAGPPAGTRFVWGNLMQRNRLNIDSDLAQPVIDGLTWSASGVNVSGKASDTALVHLYAGPPATRRYAASTAVVDGRFNFEHVSVDLMASEFSVIAHSSAGQATAESSVHREPPAGAINSVTPDTGYINGGEAVQICGVGISTNTSSPRVWFGNRPAQVDFWSGECVSVTTPQSTAGRTDIALLLGGARPIIATDAFEYRAERVVRLHQGWNFVTWSGPDTRITSAFASLAGVTLRAYAWDVDAQKWQVFATDLPPQINSLRSVSRDQPLWIFLETPDVDWSQPAPD